MIINNNLPVSQTTTGNIHNSSVESEKPKNNPKTLISAETLPSEMDSAILSERADVSAEQYLKNKYSGLGYFNGINIDLSHPDNVFGESRTANSGLLKSTAVYIHADTQARMSEDPEYAMEIAKKIEKFFDGASSSMANMNGLKGYSLAVGIDENGDYAWAACEQELEPETAEVFSAMMTSEGISAPSGIMRAIQTTAKITISEITAGDGTKTVRISASFTREETQILVKTFNGNIMDLSSGRIVNKVG